MVTWDIIFSKKAEKDVKSLKSAKLEKKAQMIIQNLKVNPYFTPPSFERLKADLSGNYSRRINLQHRIVYSVDPDNKKIIVYSMFSHYDLGS